MELPVQLGTTGWGGMGVVESRNRRISVLRSVREEGEEGGRRDKGGGTWCPEAAEALVLQSMAQTGFFRGGCCFPLYGCQW